MISSCTCAGSWLASWSLPASGSRAFSPRGESGRLPASHWCGRLPTRSCLFLTCESASLPCWEGLVNSLLFKVHLLAFFVATSENVHLGFWSFAAARGFQWEWSEVCGKGCVWFKWIFAMDFFLVPWFKFNTMHLFAHIMHISWQNCAFLFHGT